MNAHSAAVAWALAGVALAMALRARGTPLLYDRGPVRADTSFGGEAGTRARAGGLVMLDVALSTAYAVLCARISGGATLPWLVLVLVAGEVLHYAYGARTETQRWFFGVR